jgi:hypothetical protein
MGRGNRGRGTNSHQKVMSQKGNEIVIQEWAAGEVVESLPARRDLDMTEGILIGLRRCDPNATYQELLGAAKRHGVALMAISSAVADVAGIPSTGPTALEGLAYSAAYREWRDIFDICWRDAELSGAVLGVAATKDAMAPANRSTGARQPNSAVCRNPQAPTTRADIGVKEYQSQFVVATPGCWSR